MWEPFHLHGQVKRRSSTQAIPWWWLTSILVLFLKHVIHKLNNMKWPSCLAHLLNRWEVLVLNLRLSSVTFACSPCINVTMYMCYQFLMTSSRLLTAETLAIFWFSFLSTFLSGQSEMIILGGLVVQIRNAWMQPLSFVEQRLLLTSLYERI